MKTGLIIFGSLAGVAIASWAVWRFAIVPNQKFSFEVLDWKNQTVKYTDPLGSGTADYKAIASTNSPLSTTNGKMSAIITPGPDTLTFELRHTQSNGWILRDKQLVDFKNKKVTKLA